LTAYQKDAVNKKQSSWHKLSGVRSKLSCN